ncbi:MAG TPA: neprosin family prolyl endopeptidase [Candidatus Baltobacteraceae bacterium]|jgi:hypothetical protein|nr:neprosin family prolyl endopeptidase [Candidatus Baltobacteraceae bacterium]
MRFHAFVLFALASTFVPFAMPTMAVAQSPLFHCVKRTTTLQIPRSTFPSRQALKGREEEFATARKLSPACAQGLVPVAVAFTLKSFSKGNPLIGNDSTNAAMHAESVGAFIRANLLQPFDKVYWKRADDAATPIPVRLNDPPGCNGVLSFGSCYYYGNAAYTRLADGGGMTQSIERPHYDDSGGPGHSLNEIAVQGGPDNGNIVELGWIVSSDQFGDADPHLFIFHWIDWNPTCYNTCGWHQVSSTYYPGMNLKALVGQKLYIGYVHFKGAWWAWFNDQWLGYIPDSEWAGAYTKNSLIQWFGEVSSANGIPPKTAMGNGQFPASSSAASMQTLCDVDAAAWVCWVRDQQVIGATRPAYYDINHPAYGTARYGGPGT